MLDPVERENLKNMAHDFANTKHTIGDDSLQFWLLELERYYQREIGGNISLVNEKFYDLALHFFNQKKTEFWPDDVKWMHSSNGDISVKSFRYYFIKQFFFICNLF